MARPLGIIAYGTTDDRLKLAAVARVEEQSGSQVLIEHIRKRYAELFGDLDPSLAVPKGE